MELKIATWSRWNLRLLPGYFVADKHRILSDVAPEEERKNVTENAAQKSVNILASKIIIWNEN